MISADSGYKTFFLFWPTYLIWSYSSKIYWKNTGTYSVNFFVEPKINMKALPNKTVDAKRTHAYFLGSSSISLKKSAQKGGIQYVLKSPKKMLKIDVVSLI